MYPHEIFTKNKCSTIQSDSYSSNSTTPWEDGILHSVSFSKFMQTQLVPVELFTLINLIDGFDIKETAGRLGITRRYCTVVVQRLRNKYRNYFNDEDHLIFN